MPAPLAFSHVDGRLLFKSKRLLRNCFESAGALPRPEKGQALLYRQERHYARWRFAADFPRIPQTDPDHDPDDHRYDGWYAEAHPLVEELLRYPFPQVVIGFRDYAEYPGSDPPAMRFGDTLGGFVFPVRVSGRLIESEGFGYLDDVADGKPGVSMWMNIATYYERHPFPRSMIAMNHDLFTGYRVGGLMVQTGPRPQDRVVWMGTFEDYSVAGNTITARSLQVGTPAGTVEYEFKPDYAPTLTWTWEYVDHLPACPHFPT